VKDRTSPTPTINLGGRNWAKEVHSYLEGGAGASCSILEGEHRKNEPIVYFGDKGSQGKRGERLNRCFPGGRKGSPIASCGGKTVLKRGGLGGGPLTQDPTAVKAFRLRRMVRGKEASNRRGIQG